MQPAGWLVLVVALLAAAPLERPAAQQQPLVKSGTQLVRLAVLARDRDGRPVRGLTASDFSITEDGRSQEIAFFDASSAAAPTATLPPPVTGPASKDTNVRSFSNVVAVGRVRNVSVMRRRSARTGRPSWPSAPTEVPCHCREPRRDGRAASTSSSRRSTGMGRFTSISTRPSP